MKKYILLSLFLASFLQAQNFKVKGEGHQNFVFNDKISGNQIQFSSVAPFEEIKGTASNISGTVSFDLSNFEKTIQAKLTVPVKSINTGIELRNKHLQSANWMDESAYPLITFELKSISNLKQTADNKLSFKATGNFTMHGVTKEISADAETVYLNASEQTAKRAPGDLLGITADFSIKLSEFKVQNSVIGNKVAENITLKIIIVGSNKLE